MLPSTPDPIRVALNRVTFGARDLDVAFVASMGWEAWLADQLSPPTGDEPDLAAHLAAQTMPISYPAPDPVTQPLGSWKATNENRPLNTINLSVPELWYIATRAGREVSFAERLRVRQELAAATWIRNAHSRYQLREFMVDFWHNHFNIGKNENELATTLLPAYDRLVIRPHVFGNFRAMLEATATSTSMLLYLDNYLSNAVLPNENYAREIMELHTMGEGAYLGVGNTGPTPTYDDGTPKGFTDQDVINASRALSGWTIRFNQRVGNSTLGSTGEFIYNDAQHNTQATTILGESIAALTAPQAQGHRFLDLIATHPATGPFIVNKICRRIFGETYVSGAVSRGVAAWNANKAAPDQIARVLRAILADGPDVFTAVSSKVRRPYERILALLRTTDMVVNAATAMTGVLDPLNDGLFAWQAPDGRPDSSGYWLATGATLSTWNLMFQIPYWPQIETSLAAQTPLSATTPQDIVEYWLGRMIGAAPSTSSMNVLIGDQSGASGVPAARLTHNPLTTEYAHRRLVALIATIEQFTLR
jgi:uncharacterized protein (DUF1800 family)